MIIMIMRKKYKTIYKKFTINSIQNIRHYYIPLLEYSKFFLNYKIRNSGG